MSIPTIRRSHGSFHGLVCAAPATPARLPRRELVARITTFLRDHLSDPVTVADLSRMAGVSERTLRAAFHDVVGVSPKRYALMQRLEAAHQALQQADPETTTVTDVAMTFGFFELGRFAGRYRHTFGEVPSHTLRQAIADQPEQAA
jgi:transcriptional regulator GlxA family with amidase domain